MTTSATALPITACIASGMITISIANEALATKVIPWDGSSFQATMFAAFISSNPEFSYPPTTISGVLISLTELEITVVSAASGTKKFTIPFIGNACS